MSQEVAVIFRNAVDLEVFRRSHVDFIESLKEGFARGVTEVSGKTASDVVSVIYGCNPPSSEISEKTAREFLSLSQTAHLSPSALQTLGEFCQWREKNATKEHAEKLLRYSGINDETRREVASLALEMLQKKFSAVPSKSSYAMAACYLFPSSLNGLFRRRLHTAFLESQKRTAKSWLKRNYPDVVISKNDNDIRIFAKAAVEILLSQRSRAMDTRFAFWAPPALV
uniref:Uncharacterized protein n=1 Tax=Marseillevirus sp. TaxID=2809551 RepID=A0AA96J3F1_9VIRU|nr:hypothetical protein MarFTMF_479 [Marseillevirus sp.]